MDEREYIKRISPGPRNINQRMVSQGFVYPFGAYPEEPFNQAMGYDSRYIEESGLYNYEISVSHERVLSVFISLLGLLPGEARLITQIHSGDYYREYDAYVSDDPVPVTDLIEWIIAWRGVAADDGFFGIGAYSEDPAVELFLDEHKTIHVYHHNPDIMETALERLGVQFKMGLRFFWDEAHYHEPLPINDDDSDDFLSAFEDLADRYQLVLEDDDEEDTDDEGDPLGLTCWRVEIRGVSKDIITSAEKGFYSTYYLNASSRSEAADLLESYLDEKNDMADLFLQMARVPMELLTAGLREANIRPEEPGVWCETERYEFEMDLGA
ncbi:MAG: hypothetical protein OEV92_12970 [Nitrospinota bacterium]|nr:hypothetical protein [Nitrospinota bacterium]